MYGADARHGDVAAAVDGQAQVAVDGAPDRHAHLVARAHHVVTRDERQRILGDVGRVVRHQVGAEAAHLGQGGPARRRRVAPASGTGRDAILPLALRLLGVGVRFRIGVLRAALALQLVRAPLHVDLELVGLVGRLAIERSAGFGLVALARVGARAAGLLQVCRRARRLAGGIVGVDAAEVGAALAGQVVAGVAGELGARARDAEGQGDCQGTRPGQSQTGAARRRER